MKQLIVHDAPLSPISEAYRGIRTNLLYADINRSIKTILFTSSKSGEGKTTTLCNVALSLADSNKRIIIVDCNLRNPRIHKLFGLSNIQGLTDVVLKSSQYSMFIHKTAYPGLDIMTSGRIPSNPSELLGSDKIKSFFKELSDDYDYVFIDSAPVIPVTDTVIMSTYIDRVVFVCESGNLKIDIAQKATERLEKVGANVLGVVVNKMKMSKKEYRDYYLYKNISKD